jgi:hypothetical protein
MSDPVFVDCFVRLALTLLYSVFYLTFFFFRRSVFVNTVLIQWAFKIKSDPSSPIDELAFTESANAHPMLFKVIFETRVTRTLEGERVGGGLWSLRALGFFEVWRF